MSLLLYVGPLLIIALCVAFVGKEGLWHALLTFFNVLTAAVLATNYFEPAATWLDSKMPTFSYIIDLVVFWGLFTGLFILFRTLTEFASQVKVRFHKWVDVPGGMLLSVWTGWLLVCLLMMSLHVAPLPRNGFGGTFQQTPESRMFFSLAPDRQWLAFVHNLSFRSLGKADRQDESQTNVFDPEGTFILKYGTRRANFATTEELRVRRQFGSGVIEEGPEVDQ
ncbi:MAG: hypothetical protein GTO53_11860 [Planctomycetales bacterium]|nr:hypothetical protein [Planctomycetales bacterium]NIM09806.1 hypothetical protein [Planctomycetales bacterium]NIN09275.1 hypothetical protein [Planctomycetales bacterium]NIN78378.1 hypothetical protein [Planctomycetales bacterium]NIO35554.1 hypothetical protein [Planctomycetales bacterium]